MFDRDVQMYYSSIILNIHQNGWNGHQQLFELGYYIWDTSALGWNSVLCWTERSNLYLNFRHLMEFLDETLCYVEQSASTLAAHYIWVLGWNFTLDRVLLIDFLDETRSYVGNSVLRWAECSNLLKATALAAPGLHLCVIILNWQNNQRASFWSTDQYAENRLTVWLVRPFEPSFAFHFRRGESRRGKVDQVFVQGLENLVHRFDLIWWYSLIGTLV